MSARAGDEEIEVPSGDEENALPVTQGEEAEIEVPVVQREFPDAYYDPVTRCVMVDQSQHMLQSTDSGTRTLSTRAGDEEIELPSGDEENALPVPQGEEAEIEVPVVQREFPDAYYDPVTGRVMVDQSQHMLQSTDTGTRTLSTRAGDEEIEVPGDEENALPVPQGEEAEIEVPVVQREFPDAYYDPVTGRVMVDPVVNPAGDSCEQSTVVTAESAVTYYYPNRALQNIIRRDTELSAKSFRGSIRRMDSALQAEWSRLLQKSAFPSHSRPLPESFYCHITRELMVDPVIAPDGNSFERDAITQWLETNDTSPLTRNPLTVAELRPNNALYDLIQFEKNRPLESMHPSIKRWKESTEETSRRPLAENSGNPALSAPPAALDQPVTDVGGAFGICCFSLIVIWFLISYIIVVPVFTVIVLCVGVIVYHVRRKIDEGNRPT